MPKKPPPRRPGPPKAVKGEVIQWDGKPITRPGIYKGVPLDLYHSSELFAGQPAISSSGLRDIVWKSPAHYWAFSPYNPKRYPQKDKKHFKIGRAVHHLIGGERYFSSQFVIQPTEIFVPKMGRSVGWHHSRNECMEWAAEQNDNGLTILTMAEAEQIRGMTEAIGKHAAVRQGILIGQVEHSYFWRDPKTGIWLKWRPDNRPIGSMDFVDLKTTGDVRYHALVRALDEFHYYQQGALGKQACHELELEKMKSFSLFFIEKEPPHCASLQTVKEHLIVKGEKLNQLGLQRFAQCWIDNHWPGPADDDVGFIEISDRASTLLDDKIREMEG